MDYLLIKIGFGIYILRKNAREFCFQEPRDKNTPQRDMSYNRSTSKHARNRSLGKASSHELGYLGFCSALMVKAHYQPNVLIGPILKISLPKFQFEEA